MKSLQKFQLLSEPCPQRLGNRTMFCVVREVVVVNVHV